MRTAISSQGGFSIVEVLASIAIISLLTLGAIRFSESTQERTRMLKFNDSVESVLSYMRDARTNAITSKLVNGETLEGGFGVYLEYSPEEKTLQLVSFADTENDHGEGVFDGKYTSGTYSDTVLKTETISFPWKLEFTNASPDESITDSMSVFFFPPDAQMTITDGGGSSSFRNIELVFTRKSRTMHVCLNRVSRFFETLVNTSCS